MISLDSNFSDTSMKLLNLYTSNKDSPDFFQKVKDFLHSNKQTFTMILGDFNLILDPLLDCDQQKHLNNPRSRKVVLEIMNVFNLVDIFRFHHPSLKHYTWRRKNLFCQARLDYFLVSCTMHAGSSINTGYQYSN